MTRDLRDGKPRAVPRYVVTELEGYPIGDHDRAPVIGVSYQVIDNLHDRLVAIYTSEQHGRREARYLADERCRTLNLAPTANARRPGGADNQPTTQTERG